MVTIDDKIEGRLINDGLLADNKSAQDIILSDNTELEIEQNQNGQKQLNMIEERINQPNETLASINNSRTSKEHFLLNNTNSPCGIAFRSWLLNRYFF